MPADGEGVAPAFEEGVDTVAWRTLAWCAVAAFAAILALSVALSPYPLFDLGFLSGNSLIQFRNIGVQLLFELGF